MVRHWNRLPRKAVYAPALETFKDTVVSLFIARELD